MSVEAILDGAAAVIIAELEENKSDMMTDYHGSKTVKTIVLATSAHTRNLFSEMRKAADKYEPTKHLGKGKARYTICVSWDGDENGYGRGFETFSKTENGEYKSWWPTREEAQAFAEKYQAQDDENARKLRAKEITCYCPEFRGEWEIVEHSIENRQNYSVGGGYFLGHSRYSGWKVSKETLGQYNRPRILAMIEAGDCAPYLNPNACKAATEATAEQESDGAVSVEKRFNEERGGIELKFSGKPSPATLDVLKASAFKFSRRQKIWWAKRSPETEKLADAIVKRTEGHAQAIEEIASQAEPASQKEERVKVSRNTERGTIEIKFTSEEDISSDAITQRRLESNSFRYSISNRLYYADYSTERECFAKAVKEQFDSSEPAKETPEAPTNAEPASQPDAGENQTQLLLPAPETEGAITVEAEAVQLEVEEVQAEDKTDETEEVQPQDELTEEEDRAADLLFAELAKAHNLQASSANTEAPDSEPSDKTKALAFTVSQEIANFILKKGLEQVSTRDICELFVQDERITASVAAVRGIDFKGADFEGADLEEIDLEAPYTPETCMSKLSLLSSIL